MKALPVQQLPAGDWLHEIKFDGYRALAFKNGKDVRLVSRNEKAFDYPQLIDALKLLSAERVILDGEIAALDEKGRSSFQLLQVFKSSGVAPLVYYVFDLLFLEGKDLQKEPLTVRRKLLAQVLKKAPENIRLSDELRGTKNELVRVAQEFGLEGLVAKKPNSVYESGRRSGAWVKFKITKSQEFVIGGYTLPQGGVNISVLCSLATKEYRDLCMPAESTLVFRIRSWRISMRNFKDLRCPLVPL